MANVYATDFFALAESDFGRSVAPSWSARQGAAVPSFVQDEDASQDLPELIPGVRVAHARFGSGMISDVTGSGKDAKVTVDFDDESVGRKRLVIAFAGLQRGVE